MAVVVAGLGRALARVVGAASQDPRADIALRCVLFHAADGTLHLVATDKHRLAVAEVRISRGDDTLRALVPRDALPQIGDNEFDLHLLDNALELRSAESIHTLPLVDATFPDYGKLLASQAGGASVTVNGPALVDAIERAAGSEPLQMRLTSGTLELGQEPVVAVRVAYAGPDVQVELNAEYAHDAAAAVADGDVGLHLGDDAAPVVFSRHGDETALVLVMPVRVPDRQRQRRRR